MVDPFVAALTLAIESGRPAPKPKHALENAILAEQVIDDLETWSFLHRGYHEIDPLAKPLVRSPLTMLASTALTNAALRLLPEGHTKEAVLKVIVSGEGANILWNIHTAF